MAAHTNLGLLLAREPLNMPREAAMHLRAAAHYAPQQAEVHFNLAVLLHLRLRDPDQAYASYVRSLQLDVCCADTHAYFAQLAMDHFAQHELARLHFREALLIDPNHILARIGLALLLENVDSDYLAAAALYASAIRLNSVLMEPRHHLARVHLRAGQPGRSLDELTYLLLMDEPTASLHTHIAVCFAGEDRGQALQHLLQAEALEPQSAVVHFNLGVILRTPRDGEATTADADLQRALRHFQRALELVGGGCRQDDYLR